MLSMIQMMLSMIQMNMFHEVFHSIISAALGYCAMAEVMFFVLKVWAGCQVLRSLYSIKSMFINREQQ